MINHFFTFFYLLDFIGRLSLGAFKTWNVFLVVILLLPMSLTVSAGFPLECFSFNFKAWQKKKKILTVTNSFSNSFSCQQMILFIHFSRSSTIIEKFPQISSPLQINILVTPHCQGVLTPLLISSYKLLISMLMPKEGIFPRPSASCQVRL